jgi:TRAP-type C4-dicarboxylate transport system substrate-binding protein
MTRVRFVILLTALLSFFALGDDALAQTARWKTVATSRPTPHFALWTWFGEEVEKRTNGQIKVDVVSLPELGLTGFELVRVTRAGLVDVADVILAYVAGEVPLVEAVDLPGLYADLETSVKAHQSFLPALKRQEDKLGGVVLGGYIWPHQVLFTRKPVRNPSDLRGLKVRVYGTAQSEFIRALGAEPVAIAFAEVYSALERGTVDAAMTGTYSGYSLKWYEVAKFMVDVNHGPNSGALVVSKRTWDKLSPETQTTLRKLGEEFSERAWEMGRRTSKEGIDRNVEKGMEWIPLSPAMGTAVRETLTKTVLPALVKRSGPDAKPLFNQYIAPHAGLTIP